MAQEIMYSGLVNSPETTIANNVGVSDTLIYVLDPARVPSDLPNLMTIGTGTNAETVLVESINDIAITVQRGFQGVAKDWPAGTIIARNITEYDHSAFKSNIEDLDTRVGPLANLLTTIKTSIVNAINSLKGEFDAHLAESVHQGEVHGLRATSGKLEYYDGTEWKRVSGDGYPVGNVIDFTATAGDAKVTLKWQDPSDVTIEDSEGNIITIARWKGTKILRKTGSYPVNENDGVLVVDNGIRNQYSTNGFVDAGLTNDVTYYYMAFPYTTEDVYTVDSANRVSATPQAYDDSTGSPGPKNLIAGTMQAGFFGEVSASELISGDALASLVGISQGTSQNSTAGWLKFAWQGKILFVAKKSFRNSISWDHINSANAVYGDKTVEIGGLTYKVRLLRGANIGFNPKVPIKDQPDGGNGYSGAICHGSEWNRLMLPIHQEAINKNWACPDNVESDIPVWAHNLGTGTQGRYTDEDLLTHNNYGSGSYSWCQEVAESAALRVYRGNNGVSLSTSNTSSNTSSHYGWRPCLEFSV